MTCDVVPHHFLGPRVYTPIACMFVFLQILQCLTLLKLIVSLVSLGPKIVRGRLTFARSHCGGMARIHQAQSCSVPPLPWPRATARLNWHRINKPWFIYGGTLHIVTILHWLNWYPPMKQPRGLLIHDWHEWYRRICRGRFWNGLCVMSPRQDCKFSLEHLQSGALFLQPRKEDFHQEIPSFNSFWGNLPVWGMFQEGFSRGENADGSDTILASLHEKILDIYDFSW